MDWQNEVFEMRPPDNISGVLRYNDGLWTPDDGEWDLAFCALRQVTVWYISLPYYTNLQWQFLTTHWGDYVAGHPHGGNAWHCLTTDNKPAREETRWSVRDGHPNIVAGNKGMSHVASLMRSASGVGASFQTHDPFVRAGKIRLKKTGEIVMPPSGHCVYCGCDASKGLTKF